MPRVIVGKSRWFRRVCSACVSSNSCTPQKFQAAASNNCIRGCCMKIYVGNLSYATSEAELTQLFADLGAVDTVQVIRDRATGRSKGFGFVEMHDDAEAKAACEAL